MIFGGFSAEALSGRIQDCKAKVLVTADGGYRRGKLVPLKENADAAAAALSRRSSTWSSTAGPARTSTGRHGRDHWWHELEANASAICPPEPLDSEHPLYILYTSGSTGKPKGILHTTGGYLLGTTVTTKWVFDLKDDDTFWCTADVGWVTGHSYLVYGPLSNGATCVMYEGAPNWPDEGRFWKIIEDYRVTILYTAPTAIRAFMKWGEQFPRRHDLSSLRLLGTVGEPINPEAWMWYHKVIGGGRCPIVDTWWQTETGAIMISPLPGATPDGARARRPARCRASSRTSSPRTASRARPTRAGSWSSSSPGRRCCARSTATTSGTRPSTGATSPAATSPATVPGATRTATTGSWAGSTTCINVAGHRLSTMEVESALVSHPLVAEAAVVGKPDELKGQAIAAFVTLESGHEPSEALRQELRAHVDQGDRRAGPPGRDPLHRRPAQDAQRQDHAPAAPRHRRGRREHRRHHDARRPDRAGPAAARRSKTRSERSRIGVNGSAIQIGYRFLSFLRASALPLAALISGKV